MLRHPFLKLGLVAAAGVAVYEYVLDSAAKDAVRTTVKTAYDKGREVLVDLKIIRDDLKGTSVESAQKWAAAQWESAGFGDL